MRLQILSAFLLNPHYSGQDGFLVVFLCQWAYFLLVYSFIEGGTLHEFWLYNGLSIPTPHHVWVGNLTYMLGLMEALKHKSHSYSPSPSSALFFSPQGGRSFIFHLHFWLQLLLHFWPPGIFFFLFYELSSRFKRMLVFSLRVLKSFILSKM